MSYVCIVRELRQRGNDKLRVNSFLGTTEWNKWGEEERKIRGKEKKEVEKEGCEKDGKGERPFRDIKLAVTYAITEANAKLPVVLCHL